MTVKRISTQHKLDISKLNAEAISRHFQYPVMTLMSTKYAVMVTLDRWKLDPW